MPKARLRLWEVVGVDPLNEVMVIYNPSVKKYKDVLLSTGVVVEHPYYDVDYIFPNNHNVHKTNHILEDMREEIVVDANTRVIRED